MGMDWELPREWFLGRWSIKWVPDMIRRLEIYGDINQAARRFVVFGEEPPDSLCSFGVTYREVSRSGMSLWAPTQLRDPIMGLLFLVWIRTNPREALRAFREEAETVAMARRYYESQQVE